MVGLAKRGVVVVEDEASLREMVLVPGLRAYGFDTEGVATAAALYAALASERFNLVVLDIGLPGEDGFAVARHLRTFSPVGIVMLTGLTSVAHRVRGLNEGADAYLVKPVDVELLAASLHSLARRIDGASPPSVPGWQIEAGGWRLLAPSQAVVALSMAERLIVNRLAASPDEPVSRDTLVDLLAIHIEEFDPNRVETLIHRLRRKVFQQTGQELPLKVIRSTGYMLLLR